MLVYRLRFKSALHVDSRGSGEPDSVEEFIHSDTLSAALCMAWNTLYPDAADELFGAPPFQVSSAFPYIHQCFLLPAPRWPFWQNASESHEKTQKKVQWIDSSLLHQVINGKPPEWQAVKLLHTGAIAVSTASEGVERHWDGLTPWLVSERQRVAIDRLGIRQEGNLFFFGLQFFSPGCGLYFVTDVKPENQARFEAALSLLGDTGIGADRNSGLGHFEFQRADDFPWPHLTSTRGTGWLLLSLFNPGPEDNLERILATSAYGLTTRSGWISGATLGKPPVKAFTEGSYFSARPGGRVVTLFDKSQRRRLGIDHSPVRDLRALTIPCAQPSIFSAGRID